MIDDPESKKDNEYLLKQLAGALSRETRLVGKIIRLTKLLNEAEKVLHYSGHKSLSQRIHNEITAPEAVGFIEDLAAEPD